MHSYIQLKISIGNHTNKDIVYIHMKNKFMDEIDKNSDQFKLDDNELIDMANCFAKSIVDKYGKSITKNRNELKGMQHLLFANRKHINIDLNKDGLFYATGHLYVIGGLRKTNLIGDITIYFFNKYI